MYEGRGYEDTGAEMAREKDELMRYWEVGVFTGDDRKSACCSIKLAIVTKSRCSNNHTDGTQGEDEDECANMDRSIVAALVLPTTRWPLWDVSILSSGQFGLKYGGWDVSP